MERQPGASFNIRQLHHETIRGKREHKAHQQKVENVCLGKASAVTYTRYVRMLCVSFYQGCYCDVYYIHIIILNCK